MKLGFDIVPAATQVPTPETFTSELLEFQAGYILGIGSNLDPETNAVRIIEKLVERFGPILLSRAYYTAPVGIVTAHRFVNFCAFINTDLDPVECKAACVAIEMELGRDRSNPLCKVSDRTADIDLLLHLDDDLPPLDPEEVAGADYLLQPTREIVARLSGEAMPAPGPGWLELPFPAR